MNQDGIGIRQLSRLLRRTDLGQEPFVEDRREHVLRQPSETRIARVTLAQHEMVKIRIHQGETQKGAIFLAHPLDRRQLEIRGRLSVPRSFDLCEGMLGRRAPENQFALEVVRDERMLQTCAFGDPPYAGGFESTLRKFRQRRIKDHEARVNGALLLAALEFSCRRSASCR